MRISVWSSDVCSSDLTKQSCLTLRHLIRWSDQIMHRLTRRFWKCPVSLVTIPHWHNNRMSWTLVIRSSYLAVCSNAGRAFSLEQIGRAHVLTPVTNAHIVCRLLLEKKKIQQII